MRVEDPKRPRVTLLFTSSAMTCPPRRALLLDSTSPASSTPTCTSRDERVLMQSALLDSGVAWCREAPMKPAVASTKALTRETSSAEHREPASKTVRVMTIEGARLPAASIAIQSDSRSLPRALDDPGGGFERRVALLSASDEADAQNFIGESSRFGSQIRRSSIDDRWDASVRARGVVQPRAPVTTARSTEQRDAI